MVSFNWVQGYRHFFTNKPVKTPEDLKGLRIRTPPAPIWQESIRALGATPVAMAFGEMYPGLQQKAIDGVELVYNNIPGRPLLRGAEVRERDQAHHADQLRGGERQVVRRPAEGVPGRSWSRNATRPARRPRSEIFQLEAEVEQQLKGRGMTIVKDVDLAAFRKAGDKAYEVLKIIDAKNAVHKEIGKN